MNLSPDARRTNTAALQIGGVGLNKDPWSAYTHFAGFLAAVAGLVVLIVQSSHDAVELMAMSIYGGSLALLFLASASYHFFDLGERGNQWLRRIDHAAIFLLIAGTYVPSLMHLLGGAWRVTMLAVVVGLALLGVLFKLVFYKAVKRASVVMYLALGWVIVIPGYRMLPQLDAASLAWLVGGGLAYSIGAIVYARKWPDPWPETFGFHEVWHLFVLAGAAMHYVYTYTLIGAPYPSF